jgi:hypothetical protein
MTGSAPAVWLTYIEVSNSVRHPEADSQIAGSVAIRLPYGEAAFQVSETNGRLRIAPKREYRRLICVVFAVSLTKGLGH